MAETEPYLFTPGTTPLLVSLPHASSFIPDALGRRMTDAALVVADTDWHVARLYDFAAGLGAGVLTATRSRYVVDLNRDPGGGALYAGRDNTEVCPRTTFDHAPIYRPGEAPDEAEIGDRIRLHWRPYHDRLAGELERLRAAFGVAILFEGHTIRSRVPRFFDGTLADLNLGTDDGRSAAAGLRTLAFAVLELSPYEAVLDGRFTGGFITRKYGNPAERVHALQLELTWRNYMDETPPFAWRPDKADALQPVLRALLQELLRWAALYRNGH